MSMEKNKEIEYDPDNLICQECMNADKVGTCSDPFVCNRSDVDIEVLIDELVRVKEMEEKKEIVLREVSKALKASRKYKGKYSDDEFEYAKILLEELAKEEEVEEIRR